MNEPIEHPDSPAEETASEVSVPHAGVPMPTGEDRSRSSGRHGGWLVAVILIIVGIVFLIQNLGGNDAHFLENWWAFFILIPTVGSFANAWRAYVAAGRRLGPGVGQPLAIGLAMLAATIIFLFDLDWGKIWPVFIIIVGLGMVLCRRR